jgi:hypothetical protein
VGGACAAASSRGRAPALDSQQGEMSLAEADGNICSYRVNRVGWSGLPLLRHQTLHDILVDGIQGSGKASPPPGTTQRRGDRTPLARTRLGIPASLGSCDFHTSCKSAPESGRSVLGRRRRREVGLQSVEHAAAERGRPSFDPRRTCRRMQGSRGARGIVQMPTQPARRPAVGCTRSNRGRQPKCESKRVAHALRLIGAESPLQAARSWRSSGLPGPDRRPVRASGRGAAGGLVRSLLAASGYLAIGHPVAAVTARGDDPVLGVVLLPRYPELDTSDGVDSL